MKFLRSAPVISTAFALFAMLFGSGNIAFPLGLGRDLGDMAFYAMLGFSITAALVPVIGVIAMALYRGSYRDFLEPIGHFPATLAIFICFALIGPFCVIPRCIAFSHQAFQWLVPACGLLPFTLCAGLLLLVTTLRKSSVVGLMGKVLGPIKLGLLSAVIVRGLVATGQVAVCSLSQWPSFLQGIFAGYGTLDLLGVIFTSGLLVSSLAQDASGRKRTQQEMMQILVRSGLLAALILGLLYAGFIIVASQQSALAVCQGVSEAKLLSILAAILLGSGGGILASITTIVACATTAIGLTTIFAEYVSTELGLPFLNYQRAVMITSAIAVFFANYGAEGIKLLLAPVVMVLYPALIVLALTNIIAKLWGIELGRVPFYGTLVLAYILRWFN